MRRRLYIAGGVLAALVVGFLAGKFTTKPKVVETVKVETKTVTVTEWRDRIVEKQIKGPVQVRTITIEKPGGEKVVERFVYRGPVTTDRTEDGSGSAAQTGTTAATASKVTTSARPGWRLAVMAGTDRLSLSPTIYGGQIDRRLFGTLWLGAWATTEKQAGLSVALEF
jgi:hypothetical protein